MDNSFFVEINGWKLLIDPWLEGTEVDFFPWFNKQWHRTAPLAYEELPAYETVLITQKYADHYHEKTLKKLDPKQVIAPRSLENKLKKLLPKATLFLLDSKNNEINIHDVTIHFLPSKRKIDPIYDAFLLDDGKESIFIATHGFQTNERHLQLLKNIAPCQLLIAPFNRYELPFFLGGIVSPGMQGVEHLCGVLNPKKVIATHDEDKHAKGLVSKLAKITRASSTTTLLEVPWLKKRYQEINHYQLIQIS
jgi:L-ascorbate metabolism protein UlaG (beta-lactamase superfamily)